MKYFKNLRVSIIFYSFSLIPFGIVLEVNAFNSNTSATLDTLVLNVPTVTQFTDAQRVKGLQLRGTRRLSASDPVEGFESHFRRVSASGEPLADDEGLNNLADVNYVVTSLFEGLVSKYELERGEEDTEDVGRFYEDNLLTVELFDDEIMYPFHSLTYARVAGGVEFQPEYASEWFSQLGFNAPAESDALLYNGIGPKFFVSESHIDFARLLEDRPSSIEILKLRLDHENNRIEILDPKAVNVNKKIPTLQSFRTIQMHSTLEIYLQEKADFVVGVYDQRGRLKHFLSGRDGRAAWDISKTRKGVYFLRVKTESSQIVKRVVIY